MSREQTIRHDIHGEAIQTLACDYCTETDTFVGSDNVLMDVVRVVDLPLFEKIIQEHPQFETVPDPPDGWVYDAIRCEDHLTESIELPTDGYAEALVFIDLTDIRKDHTPGSGNAVIDASELTVVDYSEPAAGADPPKVEARLMQEALVEQRDYGFCRISRQERLLPTCRQLVQEGMMPPEHVENIQQAVEKARSLE